MHDTVGLSAGKKIKILVKNNTSVLQTITLNGKMFLFKVQK